MNKEILEKLLLRTEDEHPDVPEDHSLNGYMFMIAMNHWDTSEPFPMNEVKRYIRINEWVANDLNPRTELIIMRIFPKWFMKVYLMMKQFKSSSRNELLSVQDAFARMMGYPTTTASEKAFCVYDYAMQTYYEGEQNETL